MDDTMFDDLGGLCDVSFTWDIFVANPCFGDKDYDDCSCCNHCCFDIELCAPL